MSKTMKLVPGRYCSLYVLLLLLIAAACPGEALSLSIDDCLECHQDRSLTQTDSAGIVHNLYVDKKLFSESIHGKLDYTCIECHEGATQEHPASGLPDVKCEECHEEALKKYEMSKHAGLLKEGNTKAPKCYDCHTMHYNFYGDDPRSSINPQNIPKTCSTCHEGLVDGPGLFGSALVARLKGHGKVNLAGDFSVSRCLDCHFEVANHGPKEKEQPACAKCHEPGQGTINLGPIHKSEAFSRAPLRVGVKIFYGFGLAMIALAFMSMAGKKYMKPKEEENENKGH